MEHPVAVVDLDLAEGEIRRRWFVWTAAGLVLHPGVRTGGDRSPPGPGEAGALRVRVTRPDASADIALAGDGSCEAAVVRPGAATVLHERVNVDSVEAFAAFADRIVELITWSGVRQARPERRVATAQEWVQGHDGRRLNADAG